MTSQQQPPVQTLVRATRIEGAPAPYDTAHVQVTYPARDEVVDPIGTLAASAAGVPFPLVIWFPGMGTDPAYYRWLGQEVARAGYVFVTFSYVGQVPPGLTGLTPGVDLTAAAPDTFGTRPLSTVLAPLLDVLADLGRPDGDSPLAGLLDLDRVALGGHSAGGTVALESHDHRWFPQVRAVLTYASHTMASTMFGWPAGTALPLPGDCPVLLVSGTQDGLVAGSARFYGVDPADYDPIAATFTTLPDTEGARGSRTVAIKGANHFSITWPDDGGTPRAGDDLPATAPAEEIRRLICETFVHFLHLYVRRDEEAGPALDALLGSPLVEARTRQT
jgi:dienelactone hydrolase